MKKGKRIFSKLVATLSILAILLGGTFAWYATTSAINRFRGTVATIPPPELGDVGGNLHDNFSGAGATEGGQINKDVFVENTGASNIFVRVTLSELLGAETETNKPTIRKANEALAPAAGAGILQPGIDAGFTWKLGGALDPYKSITQSPEWLAIMADTTLTDAQKMTRLDELVADQLGRAITDKKANTGGAGLSDKTGMPNATVINMKQYSLMTDEDKAGYVGWIYDTDGYAYWSQQLSPGTVTGLLLDSVNIPSAGSRDYTYDIIVNMEYVDATDITAWMSGTKIKEGASAGQDAITGTDEAIDFLQKLSGTQKDLGSADELADFIGGIELAPGETAELPPKVTVDGKEVDLTWKSDDPEVATVDENGNVTAVGPGDAIITGTDQHGNKVEIPVNVDSSFGGVSATDIVFARNDRNVVVGETILGLATRVTPSNATNQTVEWSSLDTSIATVDGTTGEVRGLLVGRSTVILASVTNPDGTTIERWYTVHVVPTQTDIVLPTGLSIDGLLSRETALDTNMSAPGVTVYPAEATDYTIEWRSLDSTIAIVNSSTGQVRGIRVGMVPIEARISGTNLTATYVLHVLAPPVLTIDATRIDMDVDNREVGIGERMTAPLATVVPSDATNQTIIWTSSNDEIASINMVTGEVTGESVGVVDITASLVNPGDGRLVQTSYRLVVSNGIAQGAGTIATTRMLTAQQTGDGEWIEIARNGDYSLILRRSCIVGTSRFSSTANYVSYADQPHTTGNLRFAVNNWFTNTLSTAAPLRAYTVDHDALMKPGTASHLSSENGFSIPTGTLRGTGSDVAFPLSFQEAATYVSGRWNDNISGAETWLPSSAGALVNWNRLTDRTATSWLRTAGRSSTAASYLYTDNRVGNLLGVGHAFRVRPALWVDSAIFDQ